MSSRMSSPLFTRLIFLMALSVSSVTAVADSFEINLSDETAQFKYTNLFIADTNGRQELGFGMLFNDDDNYLAEASFIAFDVPGTKAPGFEAGVGMKFYLAKHDITNLDAFSIGLGGQLRYKFSNFPRLNVRGSLFYAPDIVSFGDAENVTEINGIIAYEMLPTVDIYIGYRFLEADFDPNGDLTIDESGYIGVKFSF